MGDSEALFLLDWFHHHMLGFWRPRKERTWRYTVRLAARAWCFMNGLGLRPRAGETQEEAESKRDFLTYRYGDALGCPERPQGLRIGYKRGPAIKFLNSTPTRRKHALLGWVPEFQHVPGPPRKAKRVRRVGPEGEDPYPAAPTVDPWPSPRRGAGIHESSYQLPPPLEGSTKNLVQTNLECAEESNTCQDSDNPWGRGSPETAMGLFDDVRATPVVAQGQAGPKHASTATAPPPWVCDVTLPEEELWMFTDPEDDDSEVLEASLALIELQWGKWRQAITESEPTSDLPPDQVQGVGGGAPTAQSM